MYLLKIYPFCKKLGKALYRFALAKVVVVLDAICPRGSVLTVSTRGSYCVTKGSISLRAFVFSLRADFLSENLTPNSTLSIKLFG